LETFTEARPLVENPRFEQDRRVAMAELDLGSIDTPIVDVVSAMDGLPYCFTLQSCCGHFVCATGQEPRTLDPVPVGYTGLVRYRIAYVGLCVENSPAGRAFLEELRAIPRIDPDYVQFGSADWWWKDWPNSYALQVEPRRHMTKDEAVLPVSEAFHVQHTRDLFFAEIRGVLARGVRSNHAG